MCSRICKHNYRITINVKIGYHDHSPAGLVVTGVPLPRDDMHSPRATGRPLSIHPRGVPRIWEGGPRNFFFRFGNLHLRMAKPCALLGGFGGMLPRENFLKQCNLVRFRVYFDQILSLFFSKNAIFYIKNKYFRYTFVMGYFS